MSRVKACARRLFVILGIGTLAACARGSADGGPRGLPRSVPPVDERGIPAKTATAAGERPPFVVAIIVDQLSAWVAEERLPLLPETGGFARLRREGTWLQTVRLPYAVTDTAPGHASMHTGKTPSESGIWGNEVPDPARGGRFTFLEDESTHLVTPDGVLDEPGSSAARLRVPNVADRLREAQPDALTVSLSLKDRGAIMPGGHKPSFALWFDKSRGTFVTSTAFAKSFPRWAAPVADASAIARARSAPWALSDRAWIERHTIVLDDGPGEGDCETYGTIFPHLAKTSAMFRALPASDQTLFDLALAAVSAEYSVEAPRSTLLLLSMSASDYVGHIFGADSWEAWDHLYKLDAALGRFLVALEAKVGPVLVVLSADHGNSSMPEVVRARRPASCAAQSGDEKTTDCYQRPVCVTGDRIEPTELERELAAEIDRAMPPASGGGWLAGVADPYVFLTGRARALPAEQRKVLDGAVRRVFERRRDTIAAIYDVRTLAQSCPKVLAEARGVPDRARPGEDVTTLVCRSWAPDVGAGDYYMVPKLGSYFDGEIVPRKGGSHGGPWLHDRTVPMLFRVAPGSSRKEGEVISDPVDFTVYSEVLASLLGLGQGTAGPARIDAILARVRAKGDFAKGDL